MTDQEYAQTAREIWVAAEGLPPHEARRILVDHGRAITTEMWMRPQDAQIYDRLPDVLPVFRGCSAGRERGWSWSLNREAAEHFAARAGDSAPMSRCSIVTGTVAKEQIVAVFSNDVWAEGEVVVPGDLVEVISIEEAES